MSNGLRFNTGGYIEYPQYKSGKFKWSDGEYGIKMLAPATIDERYRLAALYIPENAIIYNPKFTPHDCYDFMKRRASKAYVIEICSVASDSTGGIVLHRANYGESIYRGNFNRDKIVYAAGKYVEPIERFSFKDHVCDSGIHYFETVRDMGVSYLRENMYFSAFDADSVNNVNDTLATWYGACINKHKESLRKTHCGSCDTCKWEKAPSREEPCKSCEYDFNLHSFTNYERRRDLENE